MSSNRHYTTRQLEKAVALGLDTDTEVTTTTLGAGAILKIYDTVVGGSAAAPKEIDTRKPVYVRVVNLGTGLIKYLEDTFADDLNTPPDADLFANLYCDLLLNATATDDGTGEKMEWQRHRPKAIYIQAVAATKVAITKRYAQDN